MQFHLAARRRPSAALLAILVTAVAVAAGQFQTADPLRAFVRAEYLATGRCTWKRGWPQPS